MERSVCTQCFSNFNTIISIMFKIYKKIFDRWDFILYSVYSSRKAGLFGTVLGKLWFIIDPLTQMLVYYFLCVVLMRASFGNVHPLLLLTTGIVHYSIFQAIVGSATSSISKASKILLQVKIEPLIFTAISTLFAIYRVAPSLVMILLFYLYYRHAR